VALGVVTLDVEEVGRVSEGGHVPVEVSHPSMEMRIPRSDVSEVALEVLDVNGIKPNQCNEHSDIEFSDL